MDIARLSTGLSQCQTLTDVGTALLSKSLDQTKQTGDNLVKMLDASAMEQSVHPEIGGNLDLYAQSKVFAGAGTSKNLQCKLLHCKFLWYVHYATAIYITHAKCPPDLHVHFWCTEA